MQTIIECNKFPLLDILLNFYMYEISSFVRTLAWNVLKYQIYNYFFNSKIISNDVHGNWKRHCFEE
jgi:hypothetical protein